MSEKAITIYTPSSSSPHITAEDDAFIYDSLCGKTSCILGSLTCAKKDNNTVTLSGGGVSNQGYVLRIPGEDTHDLTILSGSAGVKRHDLVVAEFTKGGGDTADIHTFKIITGTASALPFDPDIVEATILNTGDVNQLVLFRVILDGIEISAIEQVAPNVDGIGKTITVSSTEPVNPVKGDIWFVTE